MPRRALLLLIPFLLVAAVRAQTFTSRVVAVRDGDTVIVLRDGKSVRIRLHGIDAPEEKQPFGPEAQQFLSDLALEKTISVHQKEIDRYGRIVGDVVLPDGADLSTSLVAAGRAWWDGQSAPGEVRLRQLEQAARTARRGLWSDPNRIPPWAWRDGFRIEDPAEAPEGRPAGLRYDPKGQARDCSAFRTQFEAQVFFVAAGGPAKDPHGLDEDGDGTACERLPDW